MALEEFRLSEELRVHEGNKLSSDTEVLPLLRQAGLSPGLKSVVLTRIRKQMSTQSHEIGIRRKIHKDFVDGKILAQNDGKDNFAALVSVPNLSVGMLFSHRAKHWLLPDSVKNILSPSGVTTLEQVFEISDLSGQVSYLLNEFTFCGRLWRDGCRSVLQVFSHP